MTLLPPRESWFDSPRLRRKWGGGWLVLPLILAGLAGALAYGINMPGESRQAPLTKLSSEEQILAQRLQRHVTTLADAIGERHGNRREALAKAEDYIRETLRATGLELQEQRFTAGSGQVANLGISQPGNSEASATIVIGAHYDSSIGSPGANDNASGVAVLLEAARILAPRPTTLAIEWVAFVNEELPWFQTEQMGSLVHARTIHTEGRTVRGMISLESVGYYTETEDSQHYPFHLGLLYPNRGNFIAFVANLGSRQWLRDCIALFRRNGHLPSEGIAAPEGVPGVGWSDHWSYWNQGYPALMITDTAWYRDPFYHTAQDLPARLDYGRMARLTTGLTDMLSELAGATTTPATH